MRCGEWEVNVDRTCGSTNKVQRYSPQHEEPPWSHLKDATLPRDRA
jgi:hypothetical protein